MTPMGLGGGQGEWDDYVWFPSGRVLVDPASVLLDSDPISAALVERVTSDPLWVEGEAPRVLLVDLDNLRAGPARWRARMAVMVALARQADHVAMAGQAGAVRRGAPYLEEFAATAIEVPAGSDLADVALLALIDELDLRDAQTLVVSNDGIFAELAHVGPLVVLSPGGDALSDALAAAAVRVLDLAALELSVTGPAGG